MSEINWGIPESVTQKATIVDFEAAKGKRLEENNRQTQRLQERREQQPAIKPVETHSPANTNTFSQLETKPHPEKQGGIIPPETQTGEIQPPAETTNTIFNFQKARENRVVSQQEESPVNTENTADI